MRKIKMMGITLLILLLLVLPLNSALAKDKINVYLFRGEGCPHCEEALEFFKKLSSDEEYGKYYNLKKYEVWYNQENASLMEKVSTELKENVTGVPYIVVGEKTFSGYSSENEDQIKKAIKEAYESNSYKDIVKIVNSKNNYSILPIVITIGAAVIIIVGLVVIAKKM